MANGVQPPCADCSAVVDALNQATGKRYEVGSIVVGRLAHQRHKENGVPACLEVIADRVQAWGREPKMFGYLRPATLFAKFNFAKYLDDIRAGGPRLAKPSDAGGYRQKWEPPAPEPPRPALTAYATLRDAFTAISARENWPDHHHARNWQVLSGFPPEEIHLWLAAHGCTLGAPAAPPAADCPFDPVRVPEDEFPPI